MPHVIEPSAGADRGTLAFLCEAYHEDRSSRRKRQDANARRDEVPPAARPDQGGRVPAGEEGRHARDRPGDLPRAEEDAGTSFYDEKGAVGRRYRRQDEAGTPYCITVDGQTLQDGTVTIRDRDTLEQKRVHQDQLIAELETRLS